MFKSANEFNQDISDWDVSKVTNIAQMFDQTGNYNNGGVSLNCWDTSNITIMDYMFYLTSFNQDISQWCVQLIGAAPNSFSRLHHLMVMQHSNQSGVNHAEDRSVVISFDDETRTFGDQQVLLLQLHLIN